MTSILTSSTSPPETQRSRDNHPVFIKRFNFQICIIRSNSTSRSPPRTHSSLPTSEPLPATTGILPCTELPCLEAPRGPPRTHQLAPPRTPSGPPRTPETLKLATTSPRDRSTLRLSFGTSCTGRPCFRPRLPSAPLPSPSHPQPTSLDRPSTLPLTPFR